MHNFSDWLIYYNKLDVRPLGQAILNSFKSLKTLFGEDPTLCLSLPALANNAMFKNFSLDSPLVYSFAKKNEDVRKIMRDNVVGGLVNVFRRHVSTYNSTLPDNVQRVPNGNMITKITATDFNALYGFCQLQELPTSPGTVY